MNFSNLLTESSDYRIKMPDFVPILIQIDSRTLYLNNNKFIVSGKISLKDFINDLKPKIKNFIPNNYIVTYTVINLDETNSAKHIVKDYTMSLEEIYINYKDPLTNFLILRLVKMTYYKRLNNFFWSK